MQFIRALELHIASLHEHDPHVMRERVAALGEAHLRKTPLDNCMRRRAMHAHLSDLNRSCGPMVQLSGKPTPSPPLRQSWRFPRPMNQCSMYVVPGSAPYHSMRPTTTKTHN